MSFIRLSIKNFPRLILVMLKKLNDFTIAITCIFSLDEQSLNNQIHVQVQVNNAGINGFDTYLDGMVNEKFFLHCVRILLSLD